uniref:Uncharacterized protein n=1 Tax=Helianthus annuus TaxID=4232 RepID=A0A251RUS3_HELAN
MGSQRVSGTLFKEPYTQGIGLYEASMFGFFLAEMRGVLVGFGVCEVKVGSVKWKLAIYTVLQISVWCTWWCRNGALSNNRQPSIVNLNK